MDIFGGGRKRKIRELRARAVVLARVIGECQRALAACAPNDEDVGGYRAARRLRAGMLESELAAHRAEMDAVAAGTIELEATTRSQARERRKASSDSTTESHASGSPFNRTGARLRWVAAAIGVGVILLAAAAPAAEALGSISMLMAPEEEVIEVDPRTMGWSATATPHAGVAVVPTPAVAGVREPRTSSNAADPGAAPSATEEMGWADLPN